MINTRFEAYKIKRELKRSGIDYEFKRHGKNEFGEPNDEIVSVGKIKGIYHEQNTSVQSTQLSSSGVVQVRSKRKPMILCLYDDVTNLELKIGDILELNDKTLKVVAVSNIQQWGIISDISLEVVDNGIQVGL